MRAVFYPSEPIILENAVKVDIVALPDKPTAKLPPMEEPAPEPPKPEVAKPEPPKLAEPKVEKPAPPPPKPEAPAVNLKQTKKDQDAALKRLEALRKLESSMQKETAPAKPQPAAPPIKGNEISHGSSLKGLVRLEHQSYLQTVDAKVKRYWNLPQWMKSSELSARVRLFIDGQGNVVKKEVTKSSGNPVYDERVATAIEAASPLPPPPDNLANLLAVDGLELEFVPN